MKKRKKKEDNRQFIGLLPQVKKSTNCLRRYLSLMICKCIKLCQKGRADLISLAKIAFIYLLGLCNCNHCTKLISYNLILVQTRPSLPPPPLNWGPDKRHLGRRWRERGREGGQAGKQLLFRVNFPNEGTRELFVSRLKWRAGAGVPIKVYESHDRHSWEKWFARALHSGRVLAWRRPRK